MCNLDQWFKLHTPFWFNIFADDTCYNYTSGKKKKFMFFLYICCLFAVIISDIVCIYNLTDQDCYNSNRMLSVLPEEKNRLTVISDLDHSRPGDFERLSVISDGEFGRCAVKSDGAFGRCVVNSEAAVISDGDFGRCAVNSTPSLVVFNMMGSIILDTSDDNFLDI